MEILYKDPNDPWNRIEFKVEDGVLHTTQWLDAEPITKWNKAARNDGRYDGRRQGMNLFARIPNTIVYDLKKKGIDVFRMSKDPGMRKRFLREIHYNYPEFKTTNRKHL